MELNREQLNDKELMMEIIEDEPYEFKRVGYKLAEDKEVVLLAVSKKGELHVPFQKKEKTN